MTYNFTKISTLLREGFDQAELRRLCDDIGDFRELAFDLADNSGRSEIANEIVRYSEKKMIIETLLNWAKENNPNQYHALAPYSNPDTEQPVEIDVPIVVVAMNDTEAKQLQQGQAEDLDVLEQILHSLEFSNISTHYTNDRNQWKPLLNSPNSIQDIVNDVIIKLNHSSHKQNPIQLHWCSEDFFSDSQDGAETRKLLNQTGCIVIVDAISMFHSTIRDFYNRSHVVGEATPIIVISPLTLLTRQINEKLEKHIYQRVMELPFSYCNGDYKLYYEFETDTNLRIKRWLYATIPSFIEKMSPNKADIMKKAYPLSQQMNKLGASRFSINMPNTTKVINV